MPRKHRPMNTGLAITLAICTAEAHAAPPVADVVRQVHAAAQENAQGNPVPWTAIGELVAMAKAADCGAFEINDEFQRHDCDTKLQEWQAKARNVLATQTLWSDRATVSLGTYDFSTGTFPLQWVIETDRVLLGQRSPPPCATAIARSAPPFTIIGQYCLYVEKPATKTAAGTIVLSGGLGQPVPSKPYLQLQSPAVVHPSGAVAAELARGLREKGDTVSIDVLIRWTWADDRCATVTTGEIKGYCWGAMLERWGIGSPLEGIAPAPPPHAE